MTQITVEKNVCEIEGLCVIANHAHTAPRARSFSTTVTEK